MKSFLINCSSEKEEKNSILVFFPYGLSNDLVVNLFLRQCTMEDDDDDDDSLLLHE